MARSPFRHGPASRRFDGIDPNAWQPKPITVDDAPELRDAEDPALAETDRSDAHASEGGSDAW